MIEEPPAEPAKLVPILQSGSFEETLRALESVVARLERGQLSIEEAVDWYEIGLGLSRRCAMLLDQAELRVRVLDDASGALDRGDEG